MDATRDVTVNTAPAVFFHITARGHELRQLFFDSNDYRSFLLILRCVAEHFHWRIHAYCLMADHYHLMLESPPGRVAAGLRCLNRHYEQHFGRRYGHDRPVFQPRFHAILIEQETYRLELCRHVVLNPVRRGVVCQPEQWRWSNYCATGGAAATPQWLDTAWTLACFARDMTSARSRYRSFVREGIAAPSLWQEVVLEALSSADEFVDLSCVKQRGGRARPLPISPARVHAQRRVN